MPLSTSPWSPDAATLLDRFLAGECTPAEAERARTLIQQSPVARELAEAITADQLPLSNADLTRSWSAIAQQTTVPASRRTPQQAQHRGHRRSPWTKLRRPHGAAFLAMYAALVLCMGIISHATFRTIPSTQRFTTRPGQRLYVTFADSTHITLAPQTTLTRTGNVATLTGEAYVSTAHHSATPLVIRTGAVTTRILGTAFDITHYAADTVTRVIVIEGKVSTGGTHTATLVAGTVARVTDSMTTITSTGDATLLTAWINGHMIFENATVPTVFAGLGRWYGVTFRLADSALATQHLSTRLDVRHSRTEICEVLELVLGVHMTAHGDTIVVTPAAHSRHDPTPIRHERRPLITPALEIGR